MHKDIIRRLEQLEKRFENNQPIVYAEYQNGECIKYEGPPPVEHMFRNDNPIIKTYGSEFAELLNAIIQPVPNRNIEDYE